MNSLLHLKNINQMYYSQYVIHEIKDTNLQLYHKAIFFYQITHIIIHLLKKKKLTFFLDK